MTWGIGALALLLGCGGSSGSDIKIDAMLDSSVSDEMLAKIKAFAVNIDYAQTVTKTYTLSHAAQRDNELIYKPLSTTHEISFGIDAVDAQGGSIAAGTSSEITITPGQGTSVTVVLSVPVVLDLGAIQDAAAAD